MKKKYMKYGQASLAILLALSSSVYLVSPIEAEAISNAKTRLIKFPYSSNQTQTQTIEIPGLRKVTALRTNNGNANYYQNGNSLTITAFGGQGERVQTGGSLEPEKTKFVTGQPSPNYSDAEGYKGTLTKYVAGGQLIPEMRRIETVTASTSEPTWYKQNVEPTLFWQSQDGFSGTIGLKSVSHTLVPQSVLLDITYTQYSTASNHEDFVNINLTKALTDIKKQFGPDNPEGLYFINPTIYSSQWIEGIQTGSWTVEGVNYAYKRDANIKILVDGFTLTAIYEGETVKPEQDTRVYLYQGTVTKPAQDTTTWETQYAYDVTVEYFDTPDVPIITVTPPNVVWGKEDFIVTIEDNEHPSLNDFRVEYKIDGEDEWKIYDSPLTISKEGTTTISSRVVDNSGNSSDTVQKTVNLDKTPPDVAVKLSTTDWSNDVVKIDVTASDSQSGVKRIQLPNGNWVNGDKITYNATENKDYVFVVEDNAGNRTTKTVKVDKLDYVLPQVDLSLDKTQWTNGDVNILISTKDSESGVKRVQLPNGNWITTSESSYRVTANGVYEFTAEDYAGNTNKQSIIVSNIDKIIPTTPTITPTNTEWASGSNSFTLSGSTDNESGVAKYQYQINNGTWKDYTGKVSISTEGVTTVNARAVDNAGNVSKTSTKTLNVDNTTPEVSIVSDPSSWTKGNVNLTATATDALSGVAKIQMPNGTWVEGSTASQTVTDNGNYVFIAQDKAGNEKVAQFTVDNIDRIVPTLSLAQMITNETNQDVEIRATASDEESGIKRIKLPNGEWVSGGNASYFAKGNGTYTFVSEDNVGNQTTKSITISNIDKTSPTAPKITNNQEWNKNPSIPVTITGGSDGQSGLKGIEYKLEGATVTGWTNYTGLFEVTSEGETKIIARTVDKVGNVSEEVVSYVRIDRTAPHNSSIIIHLKGK